MDTKLAVIILAAGLGTRMRSDRAKVLHEVLGRAMVLYVVEAARRIAGDSVVVVVGHQADTVREVVTREYPALFALQEQQLGTGHAVAQAMPMLPESASDVLILCGDVPLIRTGTLRAFIDAHYEKDLDLSVLAVSVADPTGYGRVVLDADGGLMAIVEHADATEEQRRIDTINSGIYFVKKAFLENALDRLDTDNRQGEFYLTDIARIGRADGRRVGAMVAPDTGEFFGVNSPEDLRRVETIMGEIAKSS